MNIRNIIRKLLKSSKKSEKNYIQTIFCDNIRVISFIGGK